MWLNKVPDSFLAAGLDGNIYTHQLNFTQNDFTQHTSENKDLPPKWFCKKSGLNFGFGGKLLSFSDKTNSAIGIHKVLNDEELTAKMRTFISKVEKDNNKDLSEILTEKINATVADKSVNLMWVALQCYYNNDYNPLFTALGYDKEALKQETYNYIGKKVPKGNTTKTRDFSNLNNSNQNKTIQQGKDDAASFFSEMTSKVESQKEQNASFKAQTSQVLDHTEKPNLITETISKNINWNQGSEKLIKQSLLTGDLESAVDVALKCGREAEALLIAVSSGNQELLNKTKAEYFGKNKDLFIRNIFSSIINKNFEALLDYNVIKEWREYILYAKTYLNDTKFSSFAYQIAEKLANNDDIYSSIVCFILGQNFGKCIELLYNKYLRDVENLKKKERNILLHNLFEEVIILKYILDLPSSDNQYFDALMNDYSNLLIENNLFLEACIYINKIKTKSHKLVTIYDRIYGHSESSISKLFPKLQSPYSLVNVKPKLPQVSNKNIVNNRANVNANASAQQQNKATNSLWENEKNKSSHLMNNINTNYNANKSLSQPNAYNQPLNDTPQPDTNNSNRTNINKNIPQSNKPAPPRTIPGRPNQAQNETNQFPSGDSYNNNTYNSNQPNPNNILSHPSNSRQANKPVNPPFIKGPPVPNANNTVEPRYPINNMPLNEHIRGPPVPNNSYASNPPRPNIPASNNIT